MLFKKAKFTHVEEFTVSSDDLQERVKAMEFKECAPTQEKSVGWVSPFGEESEVMSLSQGNAHLLALMVQVKSVDSNDLKNAINEKIAERKQINPEYKISKPEKEQLTQDMKFKLLPEAKSKFTKVLAYIDNDKKLMVANNTSDAFWEVVVGFVKQTFGDKIKLKAVETEMTPKAAMTKWVRDWDTPPNFTIGDSCKMESSNEMKTKMTIKNGDLEDDKVQEYLNTMEIIELTMEWTEDIGFTVNHALSLTGIKYRDMYKEKRKEDMSGDVDASARDAMELDVDFAITRDALGRMIPHVLESMKDY